MTKRVSTPLDDQAVQSLLAGDEILLTGSLYTARDAAHARFDKLLDEKRGLPVDLKGQVLFYTGPSPARPGKAAGSAGPTTSCRMDKFTPRLLQATGLKGMIGKGPRSAEVIEALEKHRAVYFAALGGAGALLGKCIVESEVVCYSELGTEAVRRLRVVEMPLIVAIDCKGNDLYRTGPEKYARACTGLSADIHNNS